MVSGARCFSALSLMETSDRLSEVSLRDLHARLGGRTVTAARLEAALGLLCEHYFLVRRELTPAKKKGRPTSPTYDVNPRAHSSQNSQNPQNPQNTTSVGFVDSVNSIEGGEPVPPTPTNGRGAR